MKVTSVCILIALFFVGIGNSLPKENFSNDVTVGQELQRRTVGERVLARGTNNLYYNGRVSGVTHSLILVDFDNGDKQYYLRRDISAIIFDTSPSSVKYRDHVIASWKGGAKHFIGFVIKVDEKLGYRVRFDDNAEDWYSKDSLRIFPHVPSPHALGSRVFARFTDKAYYRGFVVYWRHFRGVGKVDSSSVLINFDDGDKITLAKSDGSAVIADNLPACNEVKVGQHVIGYWPGRKRYYSGTVTAVNSEYFVKFDDGDKRSNAVHEVRTY